MIPTVIIFAVLVIAILLIERDIISRDRDRYRAALIKTGESVDAACREYAAHLIKDLEHKQTGLDERFEIIESQKKIIFELKEGNSRLDTVFADAKAKMRSIADIINTVSYDQDGSTAECTVPYFMNRNMNIQKTDAD